MFKVDQATARNQEVFFSIQAHNEETQAPEMPQPVKLPLTSRANVTVA